MEYTDISGRCAALIRSRDNEKVKLFSKLDKSKYRKLENLFIAEGVKLSEEALKSGLCKYLLIDEKVVRSEAVLRLVKEVGDECEPVVLASPAFQKISTETSPQGVISVCRVPEHNIIGERVFDILKDKKILALDGVRDPGNLGTVMRSALAFGFDALLVGDSADVYSPKTVRASMGAVFSLPVIETERLSETLEAFAASGRRVMGAVLRGDSLEFGKYPLDRGDIIVIGNEGHGISGAVLDVCTHFVKIPINSASESLNAAVAASVVMWEYSKLR